jgi:hypothetical protein
VQGLLRALAQPFGVPSLLVKNPSIVSTALCGPTHVPQFGTPDSEPPAPRSCVPSTSQRRLDSADALVIHAATRAAICLRRSRRGFRAFSKLATTAQARLVQHDSDDRWLILIGSFDRWASLTVSYFCLSPQNRCIFAPTKFICQLHDAGDDQFSKRCHLRCGLRRHLPTRVPLGRTD